MPPFMLNLLSIFYPAPAVESPEEDAPPAQDGISAAAVIEALPDPAIIIDPRHTILHINAPAMQLWPALKPDENLALHLRKPELLAAIAEAFTNGRSASIFFTQKIPLERNFTSNIAPINVEAVLITMRDLTHATKIEQMRVDFVANASHELKTPIASILGFVETLQGPAKNDEKARDKFLGIMRTQAQRMARLVDDLLSLSRIELLEHVPPSEQVDLCEVVRDVLAALSVVAQEHKIEVRMQLAEQAIITGARDELFRVVENLIENAMKYGESGQFVDVAIAAEGKGFVLTVRDYGPGIAEEHLPRLTERFYRVDEARSREKGGTGLGLAIVKHIISRHKGTLKFESTAGEGVKVSVGLPAH